MTREDLLKALERTLVKAKVHKLGALVSQDDLTVRELLDLTFYPQSEIAFRAAWVLEQVVEHDYVKFHPWLGDFLERFPKQDNPSCRRHFLKIMMCLQRRHEVQGVDTDPLVEAVFEWLIDKKAPIAVTVHCLTVLLNFSTGSDWIATELKEQTKFLMKAGTPAIMSRGRKILNQIKT